MLNYMRDNNATLRSTDNFSSCTSTPTTFGTTNDFASNKNVRVHCPFLVLRIYSLLIERATNFPTSRSAKMWQASEFGKFSGTTLAPFLAK